MSRAALAFSLWMSLAACGRNGPLTPWPGAPAIGSSGTPDLAAPPPADLGPPPPDLTPRATRSWEWVSPAPTGNPLRAVGGTTPDDLWLVGDVGTILHWDGARASVAGSGGPNDRFSSVAAVARDDVWIAGSSSAGSIRHWDGSGWTTDYAIAGHTIHALASSTIYVWAAVDNGGVGSVWGYAPGGGWGEVYDYNFASAPILRDVIAFGEGFYNPMFAVGDAGAILWRDNVNWTRGKPGVDGGADDPFTSDKNYFGVWGVSPSDVWATFLAGNTIGFTHFDGQAWTIAQTLPLACMNGETAHPIDRGKRLVGSDANHVFASSGFGSCPLFAFDGTKWAPLSSQLAFDASLAVAGAGVFAVTSRGELQTANSDGSWSSLPRAAVYQTLYAGAASDDGVWSLGSRPWANPLQFGDGAWQPMPALGLGNASVSLWDEWALAADDVWVAASIGQQGAVLHWDGKAWSSPIVLPGTDRLTGIWADRDDDVWAVGGGTPEDGWGFDSCRVFHFDGTRWIDVPVPMHPWGVVFPSVFGLRSDAVWISLHIDDTTHRFVWKWDGSTIQQVAYWPEDDDQTYGRPWASADDDVWIPARPVIHWDGKSWNEVPGAPDLVINAIYGTARDDVWAVGQGPFGGAIWHVEDGKLVVAVDVAPRLYGIFGSAHRLPWAVGDNGAALRLVEHAP